MMDPFTRAVVGSRSMMLPGAVQSPEVSRLITHPFPSISVGGVPFQVSNLEAAADWVVSCVIDANGPRKAVRLANAYCIALASKEPTYSRVLETGGINFPDGIPVVAVMRALNDSDAYPRRVRGPSFFRETLQRGVESGVRHFFLGSTPHTLALLEREVRGAFPGVSIAGSYSPPFGAVGEGYLNDLVDRSRKWDADVVWVGMGTPKQDFVAQALADRAGVMAIGVGAAFDFVAGTVQEAPLWIQRSGFEWLYRLVKEPRRLWQRYAFGNARFIRLVAWQVMTVKIRKARRSERQSFP